MTPGRVHVCRACSRSFASGELHCPFDGTRLEISEKDADPIIGKQIAGRYSVISRLGSGGMGVVYRALQHQLDRPVALKVLTARLGVDTQVEERFRTEARAASQLTNPHTVTVYDFGATEDGSLFIAMQLIEGESLRSRLAGGPISAWAALTIAAQVCDSLSEAHNRRPQIIHRDIKPDNIMLKQTASGEPFAVVLDFGLARFSDTQRLTATNNVIGTPAYMSPEQARGGAEVDYRADIYAVGTVLCEMLTGRTPFESQDAVQLLFKQAFDTPPLLSDLRPGIQIPESIQVIVSEMLAKTADERPASAAAVRTRLLDILRDLPPDEDAIPTADRIKTVQAPVSASPRPRVSPPPRRATPPPTSIPPPEIASLPTAMFPSEPTPRTAEMEVNAAKLRRRMRWPIAVVVALIVAVAAGVAFAMMNKTSGDSLAPLANPAPTAVREAPPAPEVKPSPPTPAPAAVVVAPAGNTGSTGVTASTGAPDAAKVAAAIPGQTAVGPTGTAASDSAAIGEKHRGKGKHNKSADDEEPSSVSTDQLDSLKL